MCVLVCIVSLSEAAHTECKSETEREREPLRKAMRRRKIQEVGGEGRRKDEDERDGGLGKKEKRLPCSVAGSQKQRAGPSLSDAWSQVPGSRGDGEKQKQQPSNCLPSCPRSLQMADLR